MGSLVYRSPDSHNQRHIQNEYDDLYSLSYVVTHLGGKTLPCEKVNIAKYEETKNNHKLYNVNQASRYARQSFLNLHTGIYSFSFSSSSVYKF